MNFLAEEFMVYSSNQTAVYSPGGIFIAGSVPPNGDTVETTRTVQPRRGMQKLRGHILMAPGAGSGVGIGPGFSSRDLQESKPGQCSLSTHPAHEIGLRTFREAFVILAIETI